MNDFLLDEDMNDACSLLDSLTTAVFLFDSTLRLHYLNSAAKTLLGPGLNNSTNLSAERIFGGNDSCTAAMRVVMETLSTHVEHEKTVNLLSHREITVDCAMSPWLKGEKAEGVLLEMVAVENQIRISREKRLLGQQLTARRVLRGLAHEIKNPLSGLRGAAQLLERELDSDDLREFTAIIIAEADRLRALVDRMLGPNTRPNPVPINIHEVTERVRQLVSAESPAGIVLSTDYDPSIPEARLDRDMIIQALLNIVKNAVHALDGQGEILIRTRVLSNYNIGENRHRLVAAIEIHDNGPGIPETMIDRVFYPMVSGENGGTGLGLAIAQSLITQHGGLIECVSRPGHTLFTVLLPLENKT